MTENQIAVDQDTAGTAVEDGEPEFEYPVTVEDVGPATKKVSVEIPESRIKDVLDTQMKELRREASLPGFRTGHAPVKLLEKRFGTEIREDVRRKLIGESYQQAVEKNKLAVMGEPEFDTTQNLTLPESGSMKFAFEVETQPEFTLPSLTGIPVKKPKVEVKDENVDQAMKNLRQQQGTLVPVEGAIEADDMITADVNLKVGETGIAHQHDAQLVARPARIGGIDVTDFVTHIVGAKSGETRTFTVAVPDTNPNEQVKGKDVTFEVAVKEVKRVELAEITPEFLEELGFENEQEIREALREQMVERINYDVAQTQRDQVSKYLVENTTLELPARLSAKQVDRVVRRRGIDLMMRGTTKEQVESQMDQLRYGAAEEAAGQLKLYFILQKVAEEMKADVDENALNGRVAMLAVQRGERPEKVKQEMSKDGSLQSLYLQMLEEAALDKVLESATIEEVDPTAKPA